MVVSKEWILAGVLMVIGAISLSAVSEKSEPKKLQQKITMTQDQATTIRSWANTYAGINTSKDYSGLNMASLSTKGIMDFTVTGTGATSTIVAPYDGEMTFSIAPTSTNKKFTISIAQGTNSPMDATQKQQFEDMIKSWGESVAGTVSGYTASSADGNISVQFSN